MHGCRLSQPCWDCWRGSYWHLIPRTISGARKIGFLVFFPPEDLHYFQEQVGFAGWKCSQFCRFGTAHEGNFHVLSSPQGSFPAQEQAHTWFALVQWPLWLQETIVILFILLSHQSFFFKSSLGVTSWGQVNSGVEKPSHGCILQWGLSSASQAWFECAVGRNEFLQYLRDKGWVNPKCEHSEQGWLPPCTLSTATSSSQPCSRHLHPDLALICGFLPQVEGWFLHAFAEEVTDIKKRVLISTLSIMQMQLRYVILIWFKTFKTPWATSLIILSSSCLEFQTLLALVQKK